MAIKDYAQIVKRLCLAFGLYFVTRVGFYFYNSQYFSNITIQEFFHALALGLRFDLATTLIANLFFIIFSLVPYRSEIYEKWLKLVFLLSQFFYVSLIIADYEYFNFTGKKLTYDLLAIPQDVADQIMQLTLSFWFLPLGVFFLMGVLVKLYPKSKFKSLDILRGAGLRWYFTPFMALFFLALTAIGIRGGLQMRSISPKQAFVFSKHELGNLALNSAYTFVRSFGEKSIGSVKYFKSDAQALKKIRQARDFSSFFKDAHKGDNVVILIVESLSQEYVDQGYAPFLSSLASEALAFPFSFANGRRSIEALSSIMTGIPSLIGTPLSQSPYQSNEFYALPKVLGEMGYRSAFYHGGKRGTMDFDAYAYSIGFDEYHAMEDYPERSHFDGHWGIFDHHYLDYIVTRLDAMSSPFLAGIFTLSSHQPYSLPAKFKGRFPKGTLPIHESIGYADFALREFFAKAKRSDWYENTLFIITADHTQKNASEAYNTELGRYRVPLIVYHPSVDLKRLSHPQRVVQHADIVPSVLDFVGGAASRKLFYGASIFNGDDGRMLNFQSGRYLYLKGQTLVSYDESQARYFRVNDDYLEYVPAQEDQGLGREALLEELRAYIQYTKHGLRHNKLYRFDEAASRL